MGPSSCVVPQCCQALLVFLKAWIVLCDAGAALCCLVGVACMPPGQPPVLQLLQG